MCSISGGISWLSGSALDLEFIKKLVVEGSTRGRDSFGIAYPLQGVSDKFIGSSEIIDFSIRNCSLFLANNRAEPTTEFVKHKQLTDVQPYTVGPITLVHNGTIANDQDLEKELGCSSRRTTSIDSEMLGFVLSERWDGVDVDSLVKLLSETVVGSIALAFYDTRNPRSVWLAVNYKPLTLFLATDNSSMYFSSLEEYADLDVETYSTSPFKKIEVPPYTLIQVKDGTLKTYSLWKDSGVSQKRALVIASSGLDSTVCASWSKHQGYDTHLLHFNYGCKATGRELEQIAAIAEDLQLPLTVMPIPFFKNDIGSSRLFETEDVVSTERSGISGAELALEWVPARNLIFMSIAAGFAEANKFDYIILGGNLEESGCILNTEANRLETGTGLWKLPSEIEVGDELLTLDSTGGQVRTQVKQIFLSTFESYVRLVFKTPTAEQEVECSNEHPFYVFNEGWVSAGYLELGDEVVVSSQSDERPVAVLVKKEFIATPVDTFNFYCEPHNSFCIGELGLLSHNSYPDNEFIFQKKFNEILPFALNLNNRVEVLTPVAHLMKHEIVKLGKELGTPFNLTWSCYKNLKTPCSECGPDFMRRMGFKMNGWIDPQAADQSSTFWEGCVRLERSEEKTTWRTL